MSDTIQVKEVKLIKIVDSPEGGGYLYKGWYNKTDADEAFAFSNNLPAKLYDFGIRENRPLFAVGDPGAKHSFRGTFVKIEPWPEMMLKYRARLVKEFDVDTNFNLVNFYPTGDFSIAQHADGELFAKKKSVFTLSLGATRRMQLTSSSGGFREFAVDHGDLFWMWGNVQQMWKHGILKEPRVTDKRISWTARSVKI